MSVPDQPLRSCERTKSAHDERVSRRRELTVIVKRGVLPTGKSTFHSASFCSVVASKRVSTEGSSASTVRSGRGQ